MKTKIFLWLSFCCIFNANASFKIETWQTTHQIPVYFVHNHEVPMLDIAVVFKAGSVYDATKNGLAELTNDMLNEGAAQYSADQLAEQFDQLGSQFSNTINLETASVTLRTLNTETNLNKSIDLLALILQQPTFPEKSLQRIKQQMQVNLQMQQQNPAATAFKNFTQLVYANHPYANAANISATTIAPLTDNDVKNFYATQYVAKNAFVVLVGDVTLTQAKQIAETITSQLALGKAAPEISPVQMNAAQAKHIHFSSTQTTVILGETAIARNDPDYFPLLIGNYILGGGSLNSLLMSTVREQDGLTYSINSEFSPLTQRGIFAISFQSRNAQTARAIQKTRTILQQYLDNGPSTHDVQMAKDFLLGNFPVSLSNNAALLNSIVPIAYYHLPLDYLDTYPQQIAHVTAQDIQHAFIRHVQPNRFIEVTVGGSS
jgi:zinc protease